MSDPKLLLLDEPSAGLPAPVVVQLELVRRIREIGLTVLIVEQNVQQVLDRALYEATTIRASGTATEMLASDTIKSRSAFEELAGESFLEIFDILEAVSCQRTEAGDSRAEKSRRSAPPGLAAWVPKTSRQKGQALSEGRFDHDLFVLGAPADVDDTAAAPPFEPLDKSSTVLRPTPTTPTAMGPRHPPSD